MRTGNTASVDHETNGTKHDVNVKKKKTHATPSQKVGRNAQARQLHPLLHVAPQRHRVAVVGTTAARALKVPADYLLAALDEQVIKSEYGAERKRDGERERERER